MRSRLTVFIFFLLLSLTAAAQTPNWPTIVKDGESGSGLATHHKMDASGNHFIAGVFFDSLRIGNTMLTSSSEVNGFVAKYSSNWTLQWVLQQQDTSTDIINGLAVDAAGNCYVSGIFTYQTTFAGTSLVATPDPGSFQPVDGMVAKLSPAGSLLWIRHLSGEGKGIPLGLSLDGAGNLYVCGHFENELIAGSVTLNGPGLSSGDGFLLRMDTNGNVLWGQKTVAAHIAGYTDVTVDMAGNAIVGGGFYDEVTVGGQTLTPPSSQPAFNLLTVKYSPAGTVLWAKYAAGNVEDDELTGNILSTDAVGNIYTAGVYGPQALDFGTVNLPAVAQGYSNGFLAKYNSNGTVQWAKALTSASYAGVSALAVDQAGNCYVGGSFEDNISFGSQTLTASAVGDLFIARYSSAGVFQWAQQGNSTEEAGIFDIQLTASQDVYLTGGFIGSLQLPGGPQISTSNDMGIFYASTIPLLATPSLLSSHTSLGLFPNPAKEQVTITVSEIQFSKGAQLRLLSLTGQQVYSREVTSNSEKVKLPELPAGVYLVELVSGTQVQRQRLVIE